MAATRLEEWQGAFERAAESTDPVARQDFLTWHNRTIAPHLNVEEGCLQILAQRLAYLFLTPGMTLDLHIRHNLAGSLVYRYSRHNRVADVAVGEKSRCAAYLLEPVTLADKGASIIYFTGTNAAPGRDVLMRLYRGTGILADGEAMLGATVFAELAHDLLAWVRRTLEDDRSVTIVGHSLAGALARRLMAALPPEDQKRAHLVAFCPAGTEADLCHKIPAERSRGVYHLADPVVLLSGEHPGGLYYEVANPVDCSRLIDHTHGSLFLAEWELISSPVELRRVRKPPTAFLALGTPGRRLLDLILRPLVQGLGLSG